MASLSVASKRRAQAPPPKERLDPFHLPPGIEMKGYKQATIQIRVSFATLRAWKKYQGPYLDDEKALVDLLLAKGVDVEINVPEKGGVKD